MSRILTLLFAVLFAGNTFAATGFPTSLDSLPNPTSTTSMSDPALSHSAQHTNLNDAMEAVQATVGVTGSAVATTHDYRLATLESGINARNYATLALADAAAVSAGKSLIISTSIALDDDLTVASPTLILRSGLLTVASAKTLTWTVQPDIGMYQVFAGAGAVSGLKEAHIDWFGGKPDESTASGAALQKAINSLTKGGIVYFDPGVYIIDTAITKPVGISITLAGAGIPQQSATVSGTELRSTLRDGTTPAISAVHATNDFSTFAMKDLYLSGGTYAEIIANESQGGTALGNAIGVSIKKQHRFIMQNVRIAGFDDAGLQIEAAYYGGVYNSSFLWNGIGVNCVDSANLDGFYNCHFQYNKYGSKNIRTSYNCGWEGNWLSGAVYAILNMRVSINEPHFESNNAGDGAGEADIFVDTTAYLDSLSITNATFNSGFYYSAKAVATYNFTGRCSRLNLVGSLHISKATPQLYPLFNLVGASTMHDLTASSKLNFDNAYAITLNSGAVTQNADTLIDVAYAGGDLPTYGRTKLRITAASAQDLATIVQASQGQSLTLVFANANTTLKHNTGNLYMKGTADVVSAARMVIEFVYDANYSRWLEK